jgi:hypothetical protein
MAALLLAIGLLTRLIGIGDHPPRTDELFHILAGRSWSENGTLAMADGEYLRARLYTIATGVMFKLFGYGLAEGRALSAIGGALQVLALGLWVRAISGNAVAGWAAALLLCFNSQAIEQSQTARFYTWHALGTWLFATATFTIVTQGAAMRWWRIVLLGAGGLLSFVIAAHLQPTAVIAFAGVAAWTGLWLLIHRKPDVIFKSDRRLAASIGAIALLGIVICLVAGQTLHDQWVIFRRAPAWAAGSVTAPGFYLNELAFAMNWLFALFPLAAVMAWRGYRDATLFCVVVLATILIAQSLGGMKATRYVYYAFPFLLAQWGLALAAAMPTIRHYLEGVAPQASRSARRALVTGLVAIVGSVALLAPNYYRDTAQAAMLLIRTGSPDRVQSAGYHRDELDWTPYVAALRPLTKRDVFIATDMQRTIYFLGDYDILLNRSELDDAGKDSGQKEFTWDDRTGRADISRGSSLQLLMRCYATGAVLMTDQKAESPDITADAADVIKDEMRPVPLPAGSRLVAYEWTTKPEPDAPECRDLYDQGYVPLRSSKDGKQPG